MQVFAIFESTAGIEQAIIDIKRTGISNQDIFVVPMEKRDNVSLSKDKRYPQGRDAVDKGFAFATGISVITAGVGFRLTLGPIIWGIMGAVAGFLIGLLISFFQAKKNGPFIPKYSVLPILLIVNGQESTITSIENILYEKGALGVNTPLKKDSVLAGK